MSLLVLVLLPLAGGLLAWALGGRRPAAARWVCLGALAGDLLLLVPRLRGGGWPARVDLPWLPELGIGVRLGLDGLSLPLVLLTLVLGALAVAASWREIETRTGLFHLCLMAVLSGVLGVFLALDLILFYLFWELMLVPMALLLALWGHERRRYATLKFFLFTQAGGLLMLVAIVSRALTGAGVTGRLTFAYEGLLGVPAVVSPWLAFAFFLGLAVKLPAFPLHPWLPDAHTEAPTGGSVVLAGLLLKTGGYAMLRFGVPLFPEAATTFARPAMVLGVAGILYGALAAVAQTDVKRLVAYTSVSHMGFVLLGVFSLDDTAWRGVVAQMVCHGLSTGGLFVVAGLLQERLGTRDLRRFGGLWASMPRLGGLALVLALASLGLPGLGNFVAEILILVGTFRVEPVLAAVAAGGLVLSALYSLRLLQRAFHGPFAGGATPADLDLRETAALGASVLLLLWIGLYPRPLLRMSGPVVDTLLTGRGADVEAEASPPAARGEETAARSPVVVHESGHGGRSERDAGGAR